MLKQCSANASQHDDGLAYRVCVRIVRTVRTTRTALKAALCTPITFTEKVKTFLVVGTRFRHQFSQSDPFQSQRTGIFSVSSISLFVLLICLEYIERFVRTTGIRRGSVGDTWTDSVDP